MTQYIVFTDLDGTLLDRESYSWAAAQGALQLLGERSVPVVICSSKTRGEIEYYRERMANGHPCVFENGGGIFIPEGCFERLQPACTGAPKRCPGGWTVALGVAYPRLRNVLCELRRAGFAVTGFGDLSVDEIAALTGLPHDQAALAKIREFDEPFIFSGSAERLADLERSVVERGLQMTRGVFHHLLGGSDKGRAVELLIGMYRQKFGEVKVIALGDALNDLPMLRHADHPVAIARPEGGHDPALELPGLMKTRGAGAAGWDEAIRTLLGLAEESSPCPY